MSVDFLTCHNCEENFCDCGHYVSCETCGAHWCSDDCAKEDGYKEEHCNYYGVFGWDALEEEREGHGCDRECCDCEHYEPDSCNLCRGEDYEDYQLLKKALELLKMTREDLIKKM